MDYMKNVFQMRKYDMETLQTSYYDKRNLWEMFIKDDHGDTVLTVFVPTTDTVEDTIQYGKYDIDDNDNNELFETTSKKTDLKAGIDFIKSLEEFAEQKDIASVIIVSDTKLTPDAHKRLIHHQSKYGDSSLHLSHFTYHEAGIPEKLKHMYQPAVIKKLEGKKLKAYFEETGMNQEAKDNYGEPYIRYMRELRRFSTEDALIKAHGFQHGDIVMIEDDDPQTFSYREYWVVLVPPLDE